MTDMTETGTVRITGERGSIRVEHRCGFPPDAVWSALTDPERLAPWYGHVRGDLRQGGSFRLVVDGSGWDGTGIVDVCDRPHRLAVTNRQSDEAWQHGEEPYSEVVDLRIRAADGGTVITAEVSGLPAAKAPFYGAGWQLNLEKVAAFLAGATLPGEDRFESLVPHYLEQVAPER